MERVWLFAAAFFLVSGMVCFVAGSDSRNSFRKSRCKAEDGKSFSPSAYGSTVAFTAVAAGGVAAFLLSKVTTEIMAVSGNSLVRLGLSVLPLTAWVMAPLGVLRGLISGTGYGRMTAVSLVSEQLLAGGIGILAARLLFQSGEKASLVYGNPDYPAAFAAKGSMLGMGAGALVSLCFMVVFYRSSWKDARRRALRNRMKNKKQ